MLITDNALQYRSRNARMYPEQNRASSYCICRWPVQSRARSGSVEAGEVQTDNVGVLRDAGRTEGGRLEHFRICVIKADIYKYLMRSV